MIYEAFTIAFDLDKKAVDVSPRCEHEKIVHRYVSYIPVKFYVTFLRGPGVEAKTEHEVSDWEYSWRGLIPNIDEIHIFTYPEHHARREREEREFQEASSNLKRDDKTTSTEEMPEGKVVTGVVAEMPKYSTLATI